MVEKAKGTAFGQLSPSSFMKSVAKRWVANLASRMPWGAREAMVQGFIRRPAKGDLDGRALLRCVADAFGVTGFEVTGKLGTFAGDRDDDAVLAHYMKTGEWAATQCEIFSQFFAKNLGGTYIDIGANIGMTVVPIARIPGVKCLAFEPEPNNFAYLKLNLLRNRVTAQIFEIALFDRKADLEFSLSNDNMGDHRLMLSDKFSEGRGATIKVSADRLDDLFEPNEIKPPLAVKIDTQGAEPAIFAGGEKTLSRANLLVFEFCPLMMRQLGGDIESEIRFIERYFIEGTLTKGDHPLNQDFLPIRNIVAELRRLASDASIGDAYFDVVVRR